MTYRIPFNKPFIVGKELYYVAQSVLSGQISGDGPFTRRCEDIFQRELGVTRALLTTSCTASLEMAAALLDIGPDDEVITPSYTFVSTANAFYSRGARVVFADIRPDTCNIDEHLLPELITERTKAIIPVHYAGIACEMNSILRTAEPLGIPVIEDAAQGVCSRYKGMPLGTLGTFGAYSFHETKNFICGEGGALLVNDERYVERAEIIREKGTDRSRFFRGEVDKYTWVDVGSSYVLSDLLAAFLFAQLENMEHITAKRRQVYERYAELLDPLAQRGLLRLPVIPEHCQPNYHMYYILLENGEVRGRLIEALKRQGILSVFHYVPLHTSPIGQRLGYRRGMLPVTESVSERLLRLPFYYELNEGEITAVVRGIYDFFGVPFE